MQMKSGAESVRWVVALLLVIAAGVSWLLYRIPPSVGRLPGGFLLAIGALNILLHRRLGRQIFAWGHSMSPIVARFWERGGETGAQLLYLGIGLILAVAGCVLLIRSA